MAALIVDENAIERKERETVRGAGPQKLQEDLGAGPGPIFPSRNLCCRIAVSGTRTPLYSALVLSRPFPGRVRGQGNKVPSGGYSAVTVRTRARCC